MDRDAFLFTLLGMGYLVATVVAGFPIYPIVVGGIFFVALIVGGAQRKSFFMFIMAAGLAGYHFARVMAKFPLWPIQILAAGLIIYIIISVAKNQMAAKAGSGVQMP